MSAEAIARLRYWASAGEPFGISRGVLIEADDLRALLDAHTEALDALETALCVLRESGAADEWDEEADMVKAVLAKAGRR